MSETLFESCGSDELDMNEFISLLSNTDIDKKYHEGNTLLIESAYNENEDLVELLINLGANLNIKNDLGYSALSYALLSNNHNLINLLMDEGAKLFYKDLPGLAICGLTKYYSTLLTDLLNSSHINAVDIFNDSIIAAFNSGNINLGLKVLSVEQYKKLVRHDTINRSFLSLIEKAGHKDCITFYIEHEPDINFANKLGITALMIATKKNDLYKVINLLESGANTSLRNKFQETVFDLAKKENNENILYALNTYKSNTSDFKYNILSKLPDKNSKEAITFLIQNIQDDNFSISEEAVRLLGALKSQEALKCLIEALDHDDQLVRAGAAEALGEIGLEESVSALTKVVNSEKLKWDLSKVKAVEALGKIGLDESVTILVQALNDKDDDVRTHAAMALGQIGSKVAIDPLVLVLQNDQSDFVVSSAAEALIKIDRESSISIFLDSLNSDNEITRHNAADALGSIGSIIAVKPLLTVLKNDQQRDVRDSAVKALGKIGSEEAILGIKEALQDKDNYVRESAAWALSELSIDK